MTENLDCKRKCYSFIRSLEKGKAFLGIWILCLFQEPFYMAPGFVLLSWSFLSGALTTMACREEGEQCPLLLCGTFWKQGPPTDAPPVLMRGIGLLACPGLNQREQECQSWFRLLEPVLLELGADVALALSWNTAAHHWVQLGSGKARRAAQVAKYVNMTIFIPQLGEKNCQLGALKIWYI